MKIVLGVPEFPPYHIGGGGIVFEALANEYTKLGHEVMVVYGYYKTHHGFENIIEYTENNIQFVQVPLLPTPGFVPFLKTVLPTGLRNLSKIHKIIKQFNPDKVHLHGYGLLFINQLAKIIWSLKIPYIYTLHGAPVSADRKGGIIGKIYNLYKKTWGKAILDHASDITAVSQYTIDNFTEFHPYKNRIRVIPNGIYPEEYSKKIDYNYYDKLMGLSNNNESKSISKGNVSSVYIDENLHESIIGGLLVESPYIISEQIIKLRNKYSNYDEIRYSKLSSFNLPFYKAVIDYLTTINFTFYTMNFSTIKIFSYSDFVAKIAHNKNNLLVFLDYFSNSGGLYIEEVIYTHVKNVIFAIRQDSKSNYLIQITDLLLALYTRNINEVKSEPKKKLLQYFYKSGLSKRLQVLENNYIDKKNKLHPPKRWVHLSTTILV